MLMIKPSDTVRTDLDLTKKQKTTRIQEKKIYKQTNRLTEGLGRIRRYLASGRRNI